MKIKDWMDINWLKMNDGKTEFILYGSRQQLLKCETTSINVNGNSIKRAEWTKCLGVSLDKNLNMKKHVAGKCKTAMFNLLKIKNIQPLLNLEAYKTLVQGLVISHLDYSNAILAGLPDNIIKKLQWVKNFSAKIILYRDRWSSVTECLKQLHWLPVRERIRHKTLTLCTSVWLVMLQCIYKTCYKSMKEGKDTSDTAWNTSTWKFCIPRREPLQQDHSVFWALHSGMSSQMN